MKIILIALVSILFTSCSIYDKHVNNLERNVSIGKDLKAHSYQNIYFSAQPKMSDFSSLREQGFTTIINLRNKNEYKESVERKTVRNLAMNYYNIPFNKNTQLTDNYIEKVTNALKESRSNGKVLIHCSSGNRVGIWLGGHFHKDHGQSKKDSIEIAKKLGLNKSKALAKLSRYLESK